MTPYGEAYHGFWQKNMYEVNQHFGTKNDLKALSKALHARGMYLMIDVVTNHMGSISSPETVDYSKLTPFNNVRSPLSLRERMLTLVEILLPPLVPDKLQ